MCQCIHSLSHSLSFTFFCYAHYTKSILCPIDLTSFMKQYTDLFTTSTTQTQNAQWMIETSAKIKLFHTRWVLLSLSLPPSASPSPHTMMTCDCCCCYCLILIWFSTFYHIWLMCSPPLAVFIKLPLFLDTQWLLCTHVSEYIPENTHRWIGINQIHFHWEYNLMLSISIEFYVLLDRSNPFERKKWIWTKWKTKVERNRFVYIDACLDEIGVCLFGLLNNIFCLFCSSTLCLHILLKRAQFNRWINLVAHIYQLLTDTQIYTHIVQGE